MELWRIDRHNRMRPIPKGQPVIGDGTIKVGNGVDLFEDLPGPTSDAAPSSPSEPSVSFTPGGDNFEVISATQPGVVDLVRIDMNENGYKAVDSGANVVTFDDDGDLKMNRSGLYEIQMTTTVYGQAGKTGAMVALGYINSIANDAFHYHNVSMNGLGTGEGRSSTEVLNLALRSANNNWEVTDVARLGARVRYLTPQDKIITQVMGMVNDSTPASVEVNWTFIPLLYI